jgi:hypothetical protein
MTAQVIVPHLSALEKHKSAIKNRFSSRTAKSSKGTLSWLALEHKPR